MALTRFAGQKRARAVALPTAMLVCLFLLVLTGALIQTQSGVFAIAQSSDSRVRSRAACQSLYDYCRYQLEHNRNWGGGIGFASVGEVDPIRAQPGGSVQLSSRVEIKEVQGRVFRGYLSEHDAGFEVEVVNALTSAATNSSAGLPTPHQHVRLSITAWQGSDLNNRGRARQQVDCLLRLAPLFDAAVLSRGNVEINAQEVVFSSKDPFRNEIRSEGDVSLPGLTGGSTVFVKNNQEVTREGSNISAMTKDRIGMLWAGDDIADGSNTLTGEELAQAAMASGGRMVDQTTSRADIYDLKPENIPQPDFADDHDIVVPPGEFRFTRARATVRYRVYETNSHGESVAVNKVKSQDIDVLEYYDPPNGPKPLKVLRSAINGVSPGEEHLGTDINYAGDITDVPVVVGDRFAVDDSFTGSITVTDAEGNETQVPEMGFRNIGAGGSSPVVIDLSSQTVSVQPATRVQPKPRAADSALPPSAFELTVKSTPWGSPGQPTFDLGNGTNDVVIQAEGDISIGEGITDGLATFISKQGSVTLNPKAQELHWVEKYFEGIPDPVWVLENEVAINAHPDYTGLVIYAEKDVNIRNISDADWGVRGFVYARRDFNFEVNSRNATFYGSVVAGNNPTEPGAFKIGNGDRATFIYDPDYLKLLTEKLPHDWTRVEPLLWTEANG